LQSALEEITKLQEIAVHQRIKAVLNGEIMKLQSEIKRLEAVAARADSKPSRTFVTLHEHAFDESDKYVKIFIPFDCTGVSDENVSLELTDNSFNVSIKSNDKEYQFKVLNLLKAIDQEKSYKKVKSDMVAVYLKKAKDGKWGFLTQTEKHLKDVKSSALDMDKEEIADDPSKGLMSMMKKMYDSGDAEMKRTIAKAWTEGQQKQQMPM
jgi:calcyclin binding protein